MNKKILLKVFLYELFLSMFISCVYYNYALSLSISINNENTSLYNKSHFNIHFTPKQNDKFIFLKTKNCFSFLNNHKHVSLKKNEITIFNKKFIGVLQKNRFKMFYVVKLKDTLYSIAKYSGHTYHELSKFNFIKKPYKIIVGQKIWVGDFLINFHKKNCSVLYLDNKNNKNYINCDVLLKKKIQLNNLLAKYMHYSTSKICFFCDLKDRKQVFLEKKYLFIPNNWNWPVKNVHLKYHYYSKSDNKQIEFFGVKDQPIFAAATGQVVCVTDIFKKYGRLIILKHDQNYLSIYAFNHFVLVKQREQVHINQKISTMGLSEKNIPQLYFEIRYKGKSINPVDILPKLDINNH